VEVVLTVWFPKPKVAGVSVAPDPVTPAPVIANVASSGLVTLLLIVSVVGYEAAVVGVNVTVTVQVAPAATEKVLEDGLHVPPSVYSVGGAATPFGNT
jgi:hypothetical protein